MAELVQTTEFVNKRYTIHRRLGAGSMGTVYHAEDRLTGQHVALKRVMANQDTTLINLNSETAATAVRVALAHEFQTLASLHHPHIIKVLDYGFDDTNQPYFTMTLLDSPRTFTEAAVNATPADQVRLIIEMLQALNYLHRRGIVHCDLKPDNALVNQEGEVKVLDFGLAALRDQSRNEEELAGTLAYMAPELFQGGSPTIASDLFAVGVMAYEIFMGRHPFDLTNTMALINDIIFTPTAIMASELQVDVAEILERLLAKTPDDRYANAHEVIEALSNAIDQPIAQETAAIRDSYLQAARFVGRDDEVRQLATAFKVAFDGLGSAWLIGGESGVGKSRLMDELRVQALVKGALVLRGQGLSGGGLTYQFWREPLRRLVLMIQVSDLEAGVLKDVLPDIESLLQRTIPDVVPLDGEAYQQRLIGTVVSLFRRLEKPTLLLLEDLQWSDESQEPLKSLVTMVSDLPLMVVGSYRSDERSDLPELLPEMQHIRLERLSPQYIASLSESMLGDIGRRDDILEFLQAETEGNVFFLVEVVRALAEEAGRLSHIGQIDLPKTIFAGGIRAAIGRRLDRVPEAERELLTLAAVAGRELDLSVLAHLKGSLELEDWLINCANYAVLELQDTRWRFSHEKLREGLVGEIPQDAQPLLHRRVAEAIEAAYPYNLELAAILANHWRAAGDADRELHYTRAAGERAVRVSALSEAIEHYERALELLPQTELAEVETADLQAELLIKLAEALKYTGNYDSARAMLERALSLNREVDNVTVVAQAELGLGEIHALRGSVVDAITHFEKSRGLFQELGDQDGMARVMNQLGLAQAQRGEYAQAMKLCEESLSISRGIDDLQNVASTANNMGLIAFRQGELATAKRYFEETLEISRTSGERRKMATALANLGSVAGSGGDLEGAKTYFEDALDISRAIGDRRIVAMSINNLGFVANLLHEYDLAVMYLEESLEIARAIGSHQAVADTLETLGQVAISQGDPERARGYFIDAAKQAKTLGAVPELLSALAGIAQVTKNPYRALEILGVITAQTAATDRTRKAAETALDEIKTKLAPQEYEAELKKAQNRSLDTLLKELLEK